MGSTSSNKKYKKCTLYNRTKHCCLSDCFHNIPNIGQLRHISHIAWCFNRNHEEALRSLLIKYKLDVIALVIASFLENYKSTRTNYRAFIHASPLLTYDINTNNKQVCPIWLNDLCDTVHNTKYIKCVIFGACGVGKSSLTCRFILNYFIDEFDPTIGDSYKRQFILNVDRYDIDKYIHDFEHYQNAIDGILSDSDLKSYQNDLLIVKYKDRQQIKLDVVDTAAWDFCFGGYTDYNERDGKIFLLVFDVMNQQSFDELQIIRDQILRSKEPQWNKTHNETDFAMIAVGNKCDLRDTLADNLCEKGSVVDMGEANQWFEKHNIPYVEISAKTGKNVNFLFRHSIYEYWIQSHSGCMVCD